MSDFIIEDGVLKNYIGKGGDVVVPEGVTSIGERAFQYCENLTSITLPEGLMSIGDGAFRDCSSLTSITLPEGVTSIGSYAFYDCRSLTSITLLEGVTSIGERAFQYCENLTSITLPESLKSIGVRAFHNTPWLKQLKRQSPKITIVNNILIFVDKDISKIIIPEEVTSIGGEAFSYCSSLTSITLPEGVTSIGNHAFWGCGNLTSITLPEGVTSIGDGAFSDCSSLTSITLPEGVTSIGEDVFSDCRSLTSITLPEGVTSIGKSAFEYCKNLTSITLLEGVTSIGKSAFEYCKNLTSITLLEGVTSIGDGAFSDCSSLTSITLPEGVTSIGDGAFSDCSSLTSITLPEGVTSIGEDVFSDCRSLTSITLPESLKSIGVSAFHNTPWLEQLKQQYPEIIIVNNIIIFVDKDISKIIIPEEVTSIGGGAFRDCSSLTSITLPEGLTSIGGGAFRDCSSLTSITLPEGLTSIGGGAFRDCSSLTSITLPEGLTSIGNHAFWGCENLTSISLPEGLTSIGVGAFSDCSSLTSITLPEGVTSIGEDVFSDCRSLTSITLPEGVTSIGSYAFEHCENLTSITLPEGVTSIGKSAFEYCKNLTSITLLEGVTSIGDGAFSDCSSLTSITLPERVTSIGDDAFSGCRSLTSITFPPNWDGDSQWLENLSSECPNLIEIKGGNQHSHYYIDNNCIVEKETGTLVFVGKNSIFSRKANIRKVSNEVNTDLFYTASFEKGFFKENEDDKGLLKYRAKLHLSEENCAEIQLYQKGRTWKSLANERKVEKDFNHVHYHLKLLEELEELKDKKLITKLAEYTSEYLSFLPKEQVERTYQLVSELKIAKAVKLLEPLMKDLDKKCLSSKNEHETEDEFAAWREEFDETELAKVLKHNFNVNIDMLCQSIERTDGNPAPEYLVLCAIVPYLMQYQKDSNTDYDIPTSNEALKLLDKNSLLAALAPKAAKRDKKILSWEKLYKKLGGKVEQDPIYLKYILKYDFHIDVKDLCSTIKLNDGTPAPEETVLQAIVPYLMHYQKDSNADYDIPTSNEALKLLDKNSLLAVLAPKAAKRDKKILSWEKIYKKLGGTFEQDPIYLKYRLKYDFCIDVKDLCSTIKLNDGTPAPEETVLQAIVPYLMQHENYRYDNQRISSADINLEKLNTTTVCEAIVAYAAEDYVWREVYKKLGGNVTENKKYLSLRGGTSITALCSELKMQDGSPATEEIVLQALVPYLYDYNGIVPAADQAAAQLDQESLHSLLLKKVSTVYALSSENDAVWLRPYVRYGGDAESKEMISNIKEWHNWYRYGQTGRNNAEIARNALYLSESRTAVLYFDKALYSYASMRGTDAETIRNTVLCEFGLDEKGEKIYDLGNRKMRVQLKIDLSLELTDVETGEVKKSLPKRGADVDLYEQAKADLSEIKKNVKKVAKARNDQLFADFLSGKTVSANSWITSYSKNALLNQVARMLVWNQGEKTFIMTDSGCVDCYGNSYTVNPEVEVGVAHPMEMTEEEVTEWQKYFTSRSLKQPFLQVWEPVIDEKEVSKDRYAGIKIPYYRLRSQAKHGITTQMDYREKYTYVEFADCYAQVQQLQFHKYSIVENEDCFEVTEFEFSKYTRQVNHIVAYLDKITIFDRIANDEADIEKYLSEFTLAQITEFINMAIEKQSNNALAVLMEYKNNKFADYDAMEEFSLE